MSNAMSAAAADHFPWNQLIPVAPQLLGLLLLAALLLALGRGRILKALRRIKKIGFAGFEFELESDLDYLAKSRDAPLTGRQAFRTIAAIERAGDLLSCARLLWVDDNPKGNVREIRFLRRLCVQIDLADSNDEAERMLHPQVYDVVVSDMARGSDYDAGEKLTDIVRKLPVPPELVYYVIKPRLTPKGAVGLTTRPDELFLLIVEALRRRRDTPLQHFKVEDER
jgi:hypothetical protein